MSATIIREGLVAAGFNDSGQFEQKEVAIVLGGVPGENGEWCFIVKGTSFCWVKGLEQGQGYLLYEYPLHGSQDTWQQQIETYMGKNPNEQDEHIQVVAGTKIALAQDDFFIIAE